jgi:hypothetical protein
MTRRSTL